MPTQIKEKICGDYKPDFFTATQIVLMVTIIVYEHLKAIDCVFKGMNTVYFCNITTKNVFRLMLLLNIMKVIMTRRNLKEYGKVFLGKDFAAALGLSGL